MITFCTASNRCTKLSLASCAMFLTWGWFSQRVQFNVQRVPFDEVHAVETLEQAKKALQKVLDRAYACLAYAD